MMSNTVSDCYNCANSNFLFFVYQILIAYNGGHCVLYCMKQHDSQQSSSSSESKPPADHKKFSFNPGDNHVHMLPFLPLSLDPSLLPHPHADFDFSVLGGKWSSHCLFIQRWKHRSLELKVRGKARKGVLFTW